MEKNILWYLQFLKILLSLKYHEYQVPYHKKAKISEDFKRLIDLETVMMVTFPLKHFLILMFDFNLISMFEYNIKDVFKSLLLLFF